MAAEKPALGAALDSAAQNSEVEFPPIALALLLDEWRRATMEGQGGWFVRLPRERYDGSGNLWSVVRRALGAEERIVLSCERRHYQAMSAANELRVLEAKVSRKKNDLVRFKEELDVAFRMRDSLKRALLDELIEALELELTALEKRAAHLRETRESRDVQEWKFPLALQGYWFKSLSV